MLCDYHVSQLRIRPISSAICTVLAINFRINKDYLDLPLVYLSRYVQSTPFHAKKYTLPSVCPKVIWLFSFDGHCPGSLVVLSRSIYTGMLFLQHHQSFRHVNISVSSTYSGRVQWIINRGYISSTYTGKVYWTEKFNFFHIFYFPTLFKAIFWQYSYDFWGLPNPFPPCLSPIILYITPVNLSREEH